MKLFKQFFQIILILGICIYFTAIFFSWFLSFDSKVNAKYLVVEGWIPSTGLNNALIEFITGEYEVLFLTGSSLKDHITLSINSFLIFHPVKSILQDSIKRRHEFSIDVQSSLGEKDSAHFVFWVNNVVLADYYTTDNNGKFHLTWVGNIFDLDSIMIQFDNDKIGKEGDRNLIVRSILLNDVELIDNNTPRFLDRGRPFGKYRWNVLASSYAELASYFFKDKGLSDDVIIPVSNNYGNIRRTYGNALALKHYFEDNNIHPDAINVVSMDYHSRRTWMVYNRLLGDKMDVGIISSENFQKERSFRSKYSYITRESLALVYYLIFILPWV